MKNLSVKMVILLSVLGQVYPASANGAETIKISAVKKTASSNTSKGQKLPRVNTRIKDKDVYYRFELMNVDPRATGEMEVEWVILVEDVAGNLDPGTAGNKKIALPFRKKIFLETDTVALRSRKWNTRLQSGSLDEKIKGYGLRVLDGQGKVLAEKYSPPSVKKKVAWDLPRFGISGDNPKLEPWQRKLRKNFNRREMGR